MNTTQTEHENASPPEPPESTWEEFVLADKQIGNTLVEYIAAEHDSGEISGRRFQTRRLNPQYPETSREKWIDTRHHDTDVDAFECANMHMHHNKQEPDSAIETQCANLHAVAFVTLLRKESK